MNNTYTSTPWGGIFLNASCESFMDFCDNMMIADEGFNPIQSIKERLKKICAYLYKKCDRAYHSLKNKHPKIANIFKRFADFFKRHSSVVEKVDMKEEIQREQQQIRAECDKLNDTIEKTIKMSEDNLKELNEIRLKTAHTIEERHKRANDVISQAVKEIFGGEDGYREKVNDMVNSKTDSDFLSDIEKRHADLRSRSSKTLSEMRRLSDESRKIADDIHNGKVRIKP